MRRNSLRCAPFVPPTVSCVLAPARTCLRQAPPTSRGRGPATSAASGCLTSTLHTLPGQKVSTPIRNSPPTSSKRLRGYVLTCFQWFPTFVFQNPNESKMETKEMVISAQAAKLYERTWARFNQMLSIIPTMTLRSLCRDSRVNYCGMQEWMAQHGYAEPERADTGKGRASDPIGTSEENPTFLQLNPVSLPQSMAHDILRQVSITFSEGTVLTLQECSPEGVVSLLDTYARRRSAMEGACLR